MFKTFLKSNSELNSAKSKSFEELKKQLNRQYEHFTGTESTLDRKMSEVEQDKARVLNGKQKDDEEQLNPIGTSKNPAMSCEDVKNKYPTKKSGY